MSRFNHNSREAEELALAWHQFGTAVSVAATLAHLHGAAHSYRKGDTLAASANGVCAFVAAAGIVFHVWATKQHVNHLKTLRPATA